MDKKRWGFAFFLLVAIAIWVGVIFWGDGSYADESDHLRQIHRFMKGNYELLSQMTTLPGYHLTVATIADFFPNLRTTHLRLISLVLALFSIPIFYLTARKLQAENPGLKTLQYIFLPVTFFYFPLMYTDIFSLLWVLLAFYFAIRKKYVWSAVFLFISLLVRQNNIVWGAFLWIYTYVLENGYVISSEKILAHLRRVAGYALVAFLFLGFVFVNKGVAVGDRAHQQVGFYLGNIYFFLALVGVLFLPVFIASVRKIKLEKNIRWGVGLGLILAAAFLLFPPAVHEYNMKMKFLRNIILFFAYHQYAWAYALTIFLGCVTLALMKLEKSALMIFPFALAALAPSWLVEQRYAIVPLVLILLLRKEFSFKVEAVLVTYFLLLSSGLVYMLLHSGIFF